MARKLKTFVTTLGFFEQAVAAPSMKAALEAWGVTQNLFHQGFAQETDDPKVVAAATAQPGTVIKRAVGSKGEFKENAELPESLPARTASRSGSLKKEKKVKRLQDVKADRDVEQAQIASYEKARKKRESERAKERDRQAAAEAKEAEKRRKATEKAQSLLDKALERHKASMDELERQKQAAERKIETEVKRWQSEKAKLDRLLRKARD